MNPAHALRGPKHSVKKGKTQALLDAIEIDRLIGLRDRALIGECRSLDAGRRLLSATARRGFRATEITAYLKNGGRLEIAQQMANHESSRTTGLYDRCGDEITLVKSSAEI